MKKNALASLLIIIALAALLAAGTWAWFTDKVEATKELAAGTVEVEINEQGFARVEVWEPGSAEEKKVSVISRGTKKSYVRVSLTPVWGCEDDNGVFQAYPDLRVDNVELGRAADYNSNWVYQEGWHYYKKIMDKDEETPLLLNSVTLNEGKTGPEYEGKVLYILANAEAVQASHEAYRDAWGLAALPPGVQTWAVP